MKKIIRTILADYQRYNNGGGKLLVDALLATNHCFAFMFWFRLCGAPKPICWIAKFMKYRIGRRYGIQIPTGTQIGAGLYIGHGIGIVINDKTKIGRNCNISHFLSIGTNIAGETAVIGDNVYIGPHVSIVGAVKIGDNVKIGAGTVVVKDVPEGCVTVGCSNRIITK